MKKIILFLCFFITNVFVFTQSFTREDLLLAINSISKEIALEPKNPTKYSMRAEFYYQLGEYQASLEDYNKSISFGLKTFDIYNSRAIVKLALGDTNGAETDLLHVIMLNKEFDEAYYNLGFIYTNTDLEKAIFYFTECIKYNRNNIDALNARGYCYRKLSKYDLAISDFTLAIKRSKVQRPNLFYNRAKCYIEINEFKSAYNDVCYALKLNSDNKYAKEILGYYYFKIGDVANSCKVWSEVRYLSQEYSEIYVSECR